MESLSISYKVQLPHAIFPDQYFLIFFNILLSILPIPESASFTIITEYQMQDTASFLLRKSLNNQNMEKGI